MAAKEQPFCHAFDLSKRLAIDINHNVHYIPVQPLSKPFDPILQALEQALNASPPTSVHRLVIPTILSPALWPTHASRPDAFLRFLHALRSLMSQNATRLTAMITLPLELHPRRSALVRWAEILCDGVIELTPFPHLMDASSGSTETSRGSEEQPQGILKVHKLPVTTERGEGGAGTGNSIGEDLAFTISRRKFTIKPFSLPPLEGDQEAQKEAGQLTAKDVEF
jgi:elongator complex protein 4